MQVQLLLTALLVGGSVAAQMLAAMKSGRPWQVVMLAVAVALTVAAQLNIGRFGHSILKKRCLNFLR
jgi:hypothetical protein